MSQNPERKLKSKEATPRKNPKPAPKSKKAKLAGKKTAPKSAKKSAPSEAAVRGSAAFQDAKSKAESYAKDPERLRKLVEVASDKSKLVRKASFADTWAKLLAMIRLVRAYYRGEYRKIPKESLLLILVAVIYFVSQIDFIPDWIPLAGLLDDGVVVGWVLKLVKDKLDAFMQWEKSQKPGQ